MKKLPTLSTEEVLKEAGLNPDGTPIATEAAPEASAEEAEIEAPAEVAATEAATEEAPANDAPATEALAKEAKVAETSEQYRARWTGKVWKKIGNKAFTEEVRAAFAARHAEIVSMLDDRKASSALKELDLDLDAARAEVIRALVNAEISKWLLWTPEGAVEPVVGKWAEPFKATPAYTDALEWLKGLDKPSLKEFSEWMDQGYGLLTKIRNPFPKTCRKCGKNVRPILVKNRQDPEGPKVWWSPDECGKCHKESGLGSATKGRLSKDVKKPGSRESSMKWKQSHGIKVETSRKPYKKGSKSK